eukprot:6478687-Amphidinium_carterae.1
MSESSADFGTNFKAGGKSILKNCHTDGARFWRSVVHSRLPGFAFHYNNPETEDFKPKAHLFSALLCCSHCTGRVNAFACTMCASTRFLLRALDAICTESAILEMSPEKILQSLLSDLLPQCDVACVVGSCLEVLKST